MLIVDNDYDKHIEREKERIYLYLADELGFLKVWDLTHLVKKIGLKTNKSYPEIKVSFNPKRKENVDCSSIATSLRKE